VYTFGGGIPPCYLQVFVQCSDIQSLDLSDNQLRKGPFV